MNALKKHLTWAWGMAAALLFAVASPALAAPGTIVGSKHDFTSGAGTYKGTNNANGQVCIYCHAPHNNTNAAGSLLWNRAASTAVYTPYSSPTMNASPAPSATIGAISKVCLSCHDGTIAVDSYGTVTGTVKATGVALIGNDLSNDHPISFTYNTALATADGALKDPSTATVTIGTGGTNTGTIAAKMLFSGQMECASCHDVHNTTARTAVQDKLVVMTTAGSALCVSCHNK